jgi:cellulose synthase/poly-beta-1,6-N-acetylglucosamine synthase-like glycosyltransferase
MTLPQSEPLISVILPAYNCQDYIREAIESILRQTFDNFELILIDDGSTDDTPLILMQFTDARIQLITQQNQGLAATLNHGIGLARGMYIARQDQDDLSLPERFMKQVAFLDAHPACAMVGTRAEIWEGRKITRRVHSHPTDNYRLKFELLFNNPFVHSSVMLRKEALQRVGGYCTDPRRQPPEDYELWSRIARFNEVANLPEVLQIYREAPGSMSRNGVSPFQQKILRICTENISWASGHPADDPQVSNISTLIHGAWESLEGTPDIIAMSMILHRAVNGMTQPKKRLFFHILAQTRLIFAAVRYWDFNNNAPWYGMPILLVRRGFRYVKYSLNLSGRGK